MSGESNRPAGLAKKHKLSRGFVYGEIRAGKLRAHKPTPDTTIITAEDEKEWLDAMPTIGAPKKTVSVDKGAA
jgi:hypothetical protein